MTTPALWTKHRPLARAIARDFYLPGSERQDVEQEALIALWIAARDFNGHGSFTAFARMVIHRKLRTAVTLARGQKHTPLNEGIRQVQDDGEWLDVGDVVAGGRDPLDVLIARERVAHLVEGIAALTETEREALLSFANRERAKHGEGGYDKRTDNALSRARRKLKAAA